MKRFPVLLLLVVAGCSGCAGLSARQKVLLPTLQMAWTPISADISLGISMLPAESQPALYTAQNEFAIALNNGDAQKMNLIPWTPLQEAAISGIEKRTTDGAISPGVAESLKERVRNFTTARAEFLSR